MLTFMAGVRQSQPGKGMQWMIRTDLPQLYLYPRCRTGHRPVGQYPQLSDKPGICLPTQHLGLLHSLSKRYNAPTDIPANPWLGKGMMKVLSWFIPYCGRRSMHYQNEQPYRFSSKILNELDIPFTPYARGLKATIQHYQALQK